MRQFLEMTAWKRYMHAEILLTREGATIQVAKAYAKAYVAAACCGLHGLADEAAERANLVRELL